MQKARRLACSTASLSSPSTTSLTPRENSRTSAGGDYIEATKPNMPRGSFKSKIRLRKRNKKTCMSLRNSKKGKKTAKANKSVKPNFGSLQNTVVLTPFHTLKKCFQTKLVDIYCNEKIKKNKYKTKMAEKQNMLFEYDVMELNPLEKKNKKKERKRSKVKKGGNGFKDKEPKSKPRKSKSEKSQSYCKCDKTRASKYKEDKSKGLSPRNQSRRPEKRRFPDSLVPNEYQLVFPISGFEESKRRRLELPQMINQTAGTEYSIMPNLIELNRASCSKLRSETNPSYSTASSHSKMDSWDTISESPSFRFFEGSLAISTTSFDSFPEHSEGDSCNCSEQSGIRSSGANSRYNSTLKALKKKPGPSNNVAHFVGYSRHDEPGQYIMAEKMDNSDRQSIDFMDHEPQAPVMPSDDPPRRKSKSQLRKSNCENDSREPYFLRSQTENKEYVQTAETEGPTVLEENRNDNELESTPLATASAVPEEGGDVEKENNNFVPEEDSLAGNPSAIDKASQADLYQPPSKLSSSKTDNATNCTNVSVTDDAVRCSSQNETNLNLNVSDEPPCEILHKRKTDTATDEQDDSVTNKSSEVDKLDYGSEGRTGEGPNLLGDFGDQTFVELFPPPETVNHIQESSDADRSVAHQPQDKEPSLVFGPRTTPGRLGESCEFSFGLNWDFSDDDSSEHGHHFL